MGAAAGGCHATGLAHSRDQSSGHPDGPCARELDGDDGRVQNGSKTAAQVAEILGVPVPDELDADA